MQSPRTLAAAFLLMSAGACAMPAIKPDDYVGGTYTEPPPVEESSAQVVVVASANMAEPAWVQVAPGQVGPLAPGMWLFAEVPAGEVQVRSGIGRSRERLDLECLPGTRAWVRVGEAGGVELESVPEPEGRSLIEDLRQVSLLLDERRASNLGTHFAGRGWIKPTAGIVVGVVVTTAVVAVLAAVFFYYAVFAPLGF